MFSASSGGQKVGRRRFEATVFGASRRGRLVRNECIGDGVRRRRRGVTCSSRSKYVAIGQAVDGAARSARFKLAVHETKTHAFLRAQIHLFRLWTFRAPSCQLVLYLISALRMSLPCSGNESTTTVSRSSRSVERRRGPNASGTHHQRPACNPVGSRARRSTSCLAIPPKT